MSKITIELTADEFRVIVEDPKALRDLLIDLDWTVVSDIVEVLVSQAEANDQA